MRQSFTMKSFLRLLTLCLIPASAFAATPAPPAPPQKPAAAHRYTIDQFLATTLYGGASFSPDGRKILVSSNRSGVTNVYSLPVDGGEPVQLTDSKVSEVNAESYFPADERFLYSSDQGGNEQTHLYVKAPDGSVRDLTPGDKLKAAFFDWTQDEKGFFFLSNERDPSAFDLYEMSIDGYQKKLLYTNDGGYDISAVSPDGRWVALSKQRTSSDSDILLHDRTTGKTELLTPKPAAGGEVANIAEAFSPDGKSLFYTTDQGSEFAYLMRYDLVAGERKEVLRTEWDVTGASFSRDRKTLVTTINRDARTELRLLDAATLHPVELPRLPAGNVTGVRFSRDGRRMAFYVESSAPRDLYVRAMDTGKVRQLTHALSPEIDPADIVQAEVVRFKSYDGVVIPGLLYKPRGASAADRAPALVSVHGGPGDQSRVGYSELTQYLVNHGYAVYSINNRGSSGYGKTFYAMDDRKHGDADLGDCVASKKMLADTGWVDASRIGIIGGSYGGYMVLAALTFQPREFALGVDFYGVSNWPRTLESIPAWWGSGRDAIYKELGDPVKDADYLKKISPLFHADQIERPLLVLQGVNDPRVLKSESDTIVEAARKKGVPVEYLLFENEGHGLRRRDSKEKAFRATLEFLDKYMKGAAKEAPAR
jgi:dipeptidyl aminopeptidase/acylaminoacyl peptidase